jgi:small-conductance mechanosensitive channel
LSTEGVLSNPEPFVLQTSLGDSYVSYEINAFTAKPHVMAVTYSALHQNIQEKFNEAGVEIMSPHYGALRDGNQTTVPPNYLSQSYAAPRFGVELSKDGEGLSSTSKTPS